jgi:glycosyltransferase involved in cell wall biosynthesis
MKVLYISYDGMTDPLGQAQVIPYLQGLSELHGHQFVLLSFEKSENYSLHKDKINSLLKPYHIIWKPQMYTKKPPVLSTLKDVYTMHKEAISICKKHQIQALHCRSYISALVGLMLKKSLKLKFIFDMRGFWADERVDGKLWNLSNPIFKTIYNFFKKKELQFFQQADYTISLTHNGKNEILSWPEIDASKTKIQVIPCCVNTTLFSQKNIKPELQVAFRTKLNIQENEPVITYIGSVGTWYLLDEMLDFFKVFKEYKSNAKFLFITPDKPEYILNAAQAKGLNKVDFPIIKGERENIPTLLSLCDASIFFIKQAYSKKASSPTKQGELMSMGIPVICNALVGDTDYVVNTYQSGIVVEDFTNEAYHKVAQNFDKLLSLDKSRIEAGAEDFYSLHKGIEKYHEVYEAVVNQ